MHRPHATRRRVLLRRIGLAVSGLGVAGVAGVAGGVQDNPARRGSVVASFSVLADLARTVAGPGVDVVSLVGVDADSHAFEPGPKHAQLLRQADVVVVNGLGFEGWIERLIKASGFKGRLVVASAGVTALTFSKAPGGGHSHGHRDDRAHPPTSTLAGDVDPHAWQDLRMGVRYLQTIAQALATRWPEHGQGFESRSSAHAKQLLTLHEQLVALVKDVPEVHRRIITSHEGFAYLGRAYGFKVDAVQGWSNASAPSAQAMAQLVRRARAQQVRAVFLENISDPKLAQRVARDSGARVGGKLYSDALSASSGPAGSYGAMVQHNVTTIVQALKA
jgi:zinc/manganese transport system substrate-binding protein